MAPHGEPAPRRELGGSSPARRAPLGSASRDRSTVELPAWVVDEVLAPAKPVAFRLVVMLYRHGWQTTDGRGGRRLWWRGSLAELSRLVGATKPHLIEAERYLSGVGFLLVHERTDPRSPHAVSIPIDRPSGHNLLPLAESEIRQHDGDLEIPSSVSHEDLITTTTAGEAVTICNRLAEYGVTSPARWLEDVGAARCVEALDHMDSLDPSRFTNPAGFLRGLVYGTSIIPARRTTHFQLSPSAPGADLEARKRYYGVPVFARPWSGRS